MMFGRGISRSGNVLDLAVENGFIAKSGAWFSIDEERIGQGRENAKIYLEEHPDVMLQMENKVREKYGLPQLEAAATKEVTED